MHEKYDTISPNNSAQNYVVSATKSGTVHGFHASRERFIPQRKELLATRVPPAAAPTSASPRLASRLDRSHMACATCVAHRFRAVAAADIVRRRSSSSWCVAAAAFWPPLPLALMGACLIKASVGPEHDENTRKRLGAPAAATCAAPRRVDSVALSAHLRSEVTGRRQPADSYSIDRAADGDQRGVRQIWCAVLRAPSVYCISAQLAP